MTEPRMPDEAGLEEMLGEIEVIRLARENYSSVESTQGELVERLRNLHHWYAPREGNHRPEDDIKRPNKINISAQYCKAAVDVDARLQALLPRVSHDPLGNDEDSRRAASEAEKTMLRFLELSGWDVWLADFAKVKCVYGLGWLKPFWNVGENRPDVIVIENTANIRAGWGASDFSVLDWVICEYSLSPIEIMRRYPDITVHPDRSSDVRYRIEKSTGTHDDPLDQGLALTMGPNIMRRPLPYQPSDYEQKQVPVWDFWFKDLDNKVWNAIIVGRNVIAKMAKHNELPDIPYIPIENDHEPGVPWGIATHEPLIDLNFELDRVLSHAAQLIQDEIDPAWQLVGENADSVPDGAIPRAGEIIAVGPGNEVKSLPKSVNFPIIQQFIAELKEEFHDISGLPRILFGQSPGSQTTGRALAVQVEAAANRLDFKRRRLYAGLRTLLNFWAFMLEKRKPRAGAVRLDRVVKGYRRWELIAPEITPKDVIESTQNAINKINAKVVSLETAREELGYDSPQDEGEKVVNERRNLALFPGEVQVMAGAMLQLAQLQQMGMSLPGGAGAPPPEAGQGAVQNAAQVAQPVRPNDDNAQEGEGAAPMTQPGSPSPPGGGVQSASTTLIRPQASGQAQALNQIAINRRL